MSLETLRMVCWAAIFLGMALSTAYVYLRFDWSKTAQKNLASRLVPTAALGVAFIFLASFIIDQKEVGCVRKRSNGCIDILPNFIKNNLEAWSLIASIGLVLSSALMVRLVILLYMHKLDTDLK